MTAIVAIKHDRGILVSADSLAIFTDNNHIITELDTSTVKIHPISNNVVIGISGDLIDVNNIGKLARVIGRRIKDMNTVDFKDINRLAHEEFLDFTEESTQAQMLIAGRGTFGSKKKRYEMFIVDVDHKTHRQKEFIVGVGMQFYLNNAIAMIKKSGHLKTRPTMSQAQSQTKYLFDHCYEVSKSRVEDEFNDVGKIHIGGAVRQININESGVNDLDPTLNYDALVKIGDRIFTDAS